MTGEKISDERKEKVQVGNLIAKVFAKKINVFTHYYDKMILVHTVYIDSFDILILISFVYVDIWDTLILSLILIY